MGRASVTIAAHQPAGARAASSVPVLASTAGVRGCWMARLIIGSISEPSAFVCRCATAANCGCRYGAAAFAHGSTSHSGAGAATPSNGDPREYPPVI